MTQADHSTPGASTRSGALKSPASKWFRVINMIGYGILVIVVFSLVGRLRHMQETNHSLTRNVAIYQTRLAQTSSQTMERLRQVEDRSRALLSQTAKSMETQNHRSGEEVLSTSKQLVQALANREATARENIVNELKKANQEIVALRMDLQNNVTKQAEKERIFQRIQQEWDPSILLIHSEFTYKERNDEGKMEEHTGSGWGTGFAVTKDGHIITNKHVVQPWKFDPELCAMEAMGEIEILTKKVKISAWRSGTRCMDDEREMIRDTGFNNTTLKNLRILAVADDHMSRKEINLGGSSVPYEIHALDNNDLAVLKCDGVIWKPVSCASVKGRGSLNKLDSIMALGFPRGQNGLERGLAETSPSLGTVRKVENTIHVTCSIIPGNSGGPLFDERGDVVGIATRIYSETLGICIKIDHALALLDSVKQSPAKATGGSAPETAAVPKIMGSVERK